ncbi:hypothetical protein G4D82_12505 [Flavobacterium sp. CYK-4]|uniref:DUF6998 domain-containing protein n=1 Tax=Flavobacterium lotistagni TaxID=2709660 RepID=UPI00140A20F2|nr:hypothetical protein [Flavobacterium lotistagni]NHM08045.1 hypothetical protein [Flavobacterium lotistagni]
MHQIQQLLSITQQLKAQYGRSFSLDGRLVGDIGEVLAAEAYGLDLLPENSFKHDAKERATGKLVQIKASFKGYCYFPYGVDRIPDHFLALNINSDGSLTELFNGPGSFIVEHYIQKRGLKHYKETFYTLSKGSLINLNKQVPDEQKIKRKVA